MDRQIWLCADCSDWHGRSCAEIGAGERKSGDTIVAEVPVVAEFGLEGLRRTRNRRRIGRECRCQTRSGPTAPRNNNIRAEIEQAAMLFDVDVRMMKGLPRSSLATIRKPRPANTTCSIFLILGVCQILAWRHLFYFIAAA